MLSYESCCVWLWKTKGHLRTSFIVSVDIWEGRNERHEDRWAETGAATLKNPLLICHCQGLSAGVHSGTRSNTNEQMKQCEQCWDTLQGQQENSHSAENMTNGILFSWLILFQPTLFRLFFLLFPVQKSVRLMENNHRKYDNELSAAHV